MGGARFHYPVRVNHLDHIIQQCRHNNRIAQEKLYRAFFGLFYTVSREYTTDHETLLAIINEAFLKIFLHIEEFDIAKGSFETWSKKIVRNVCIDHYRRMKTQVDTVELTGQLDSPYYDATHLHSRDIEYYFSQLPNMTGKVCRMFLVQGYSHKEIGTALNITEGTSRWHLSEGKKRLQELLKKKYA